MHDYTSVRIRVTLDGVADDGDVAADGISSAELDNYGADVENIVGGRHAPHEIVGSAADNTITIDNGFDDVVDGAAGVDTISTGGGNDTVQARDGIADRIDCGSGTDRVVADAVDVVANCEVVELEAGPTVPPEHRQAGSGQRREAGRRLRADRCGPPDQA